MDHAASAPERPVSGWRAAQLASVFACIAALVLVTAFADAPGWGSGGGGSSGRGGGGDAPATAAPSRVASSLVLFSAQASLLVATVLSFFLVTGGGPEARLGMCGAYLARHRFFYVCALLAAAALAAGGGCRLAAAGASSGVPS